jgi:hypothetical protein
MYSFDTLSKQAKSSLAHYVDMYVRESLGHIEGSFTATNVKAIIERIKSLYWERRVNKDYIAEISEGIKHEEFIKDLERFIVNFLNNRPTQSRVNYYNELCKKYGFTPKVIANKDKLELRINKIIETNGRTQDI